MRLAGKVAIITGAGRGIGKTFAIRFAQEGARLLLPDINLESAEATATVIKAKGGEASAIQVDISDEQAVQRMAKKAIQLYDKVDILVNNAAVISGIRPRPWDAWEPADWRLILGVNVIGTWQCCKAIAPLMVRQGRGKIINMASDIPKIHQGNNLTPYACSKSAIYTLTQNMAVALGVANINVNAIAPGRTDTGADLRVNGEDHSFDSTIFLQAIKRREIPEDLVGTAVFLASEDSDFITGQIIFVNGGATME